MWKNFCVYFFLNTLPTYFKTLKISLLHVSGSGRKTNAQNSHLLKWLVGSYFVNIYLRFTDNVVL